MDGRGREEDAADTAATLVVTAVLAVELQGSDIKRLSMKIQWPDGKAFAFAVFDDPDRDMMGNTKPVYEFLHDLGLRTTKGVWMLDAEDHGGPIGLSCENPEYLEWILSLQSAGFEIGYHNARSYDSTREQTRQALDMFRQRFGGCIEWRGPALPGMVVTCWKVLEVGNHALLCQ